MKQLEIRLNAKEHAKFCKVMDRKMKKRKIDIQGLAEIIGVAPKSIYNFRKDTTKNPSKYLAAKIANELEIDKEDYKIKGSFLAIIPFVVMLMVPVKANAETYIPDIPITEEEQEQIKEICESKNISFALVMAIMDKESTFKRDVISADGNNKGPMQLNPRYFDIDDPFDVIESVDVATDWLLILFNENNDVCWVLDRYNGNAYADLNYQKGKVSSYSKWITGRSFEIEQIIYGRD